VHIRAGGSQVRCRSRCVDISNRVVPGFSSVYLIEAILKQCKQVATLDRSSALYQYTLKMVHRRKTIRSDVEVNIIIVEWIEIRVKLVCRIDMVG